MKAEAHFTSRSDARLAGDSVGHIEARGIEFIPEPDRHGRTSDVALVFFGSQLTYGSVIMGAMPIAFGLTVVQSLWAILVGTLIGAAGLAGMAMLGPGSGTNSVVASGAFFWRARAACGLGGDRGDRSWLFRDVHLGVRAATRAAAAYCRGGRGAYDDGVFDLGVCGGDAGDRRALGMRRSWLTKR